MSLDILDQDLYQPQIKLGGLLDVNPTNFSDRDLLNEINRIRKDFIDNPLIEVKFTDQLPLELIGSPVLIDFDYKIRTNQTILYKWIRHNLTLTFYQTIRTLPNHIIERLQLHLNDTYESKDLNGCLEYAAKIGNIKLVKYLLDDLDVDVNANNGQALINAIESGHANVVGYLCYARGQTHMNKNGALIIAIRLKNLPIIRTLIARGADVNITYQGLTNRPLNLAFEMKNTEIIRILIESGAELSNACTNINNFIALGNLNFIEYLVGKGMLLDEYNLIFAAENGKLDIVQYIIDKGFTGSSALAAAAIHNHLHVVKYLVNIGITDTDTGYALICAVRANHLEITEFLVSEIEYTQETKGKALLEAIYQDNIDIVRCLVKLDIRDLLILQESIKYGNLEIVKLIMDCNPDVNMKDNLLLTISVVHDHLDIFKYLIEFSYVTHIFLKELQTKSTQDIKKYIQDLIDNEQYF
jgi:ankyrin repeat protein